MMITPAGFCQAPEPHEAALGLAASILDARLEGITAPESDEDDPRRKHAAELLRKLLDDTRPAAVEAMAMLLGFDLGVDCDLALLFEAKVRGQRILPHLLRDRDAPSPIAGKEYSPALLRSAE